MALKIIGGDFSQNSVIVPVPGGVGLTGKDVGANAQRGKGIFGFMKVAKVPIKSIEQITEENKKKFGSAAGWGLIGGLALGPIGALAGVMAGGNKKEICFACELEDGRKFVAITDPATYQQFVASSRGS